MQLATYIEYILMTRHYCCVPGLGVWMSKETASRSERINGDIRLTPPHREISFSSQMLHDDGVLVTLIMESAGLSYDEATAWQKREVAAILARLDRGSVAIGHMGSLKRINGQICYDAPTLYASDPTCYGLDVITMSPWKKLENLGSESKNDQATADHDNYHITLPKQWIKNVAVVILVICAMFAGTNPWGSDSRNELATIVNTDFLKASFHLNTLTAQSWNEEWEDAAVLDSIVEKEALTPLTELHADTTRQMPGVWKEASREGMPDSQALMTESPNGKIYYIIVASCSNEENARQALRKLSDQGYEEIGILAREGKFRLYINLFSLKPDAESYLNTLRRDERFHDAWLLPVRAESLSQIKKETTYNGNYLSMELSNAERGTESDQG